MISCGGIWNGGLASRSASVNRARAISWNPSLADRTSSSQSIRNSNLHTSRAGDSGSLRQLKISLRAIRRSWYVGLRTFHLLCSLSFEFIQASLKLLRFFLKTLNLICKDFGYFPSALLVWTSVMHLVHFYSPVRLVRHGHLPRGWSGLVIAQAKKKNDPGSVAGVVYSDECDAAFGKCLEDRIVGQFSLLAPEPFIHLSLVADEVKPALQIFCNERPSLIRDVPAVYEVLK